VTTIYLVSCVGQKRDYPTMAKDLYVSDWFVKARAWVEQEGGDDSWLILSAEYGLVEPDEHIHPYEKTLKKLSKKQREDWAEFVYDELMFYLAPEDRVVILAGRYYREFLEPWLIEDGFDVEVPLAGLGIGEQKQWLKRNTR
jgi:hypothetical protein